MDDPYRSFARPAAADVVSLRVIGPTIYAMVTTPAITSVEAPVVAEALHGALADAAPGTRHLVLDLEQVTFVNSMTLGTLVATYTTALHRGARLLLTGVSPSVLEILEATRLTRLLTICRTPADLEAAMGAGQQPG